MAASALNRIGNAMVLPGDRDANGLRRKALSIAPEEYTFSIRDEKHRRCASGRPSTGVKWFSVPEARNARCSLCNTSRATRDATTTGATHPASEGQLLLGQRGVHEVIGRSVHERQRPRHVSSGLRSAGTQKSAAISPAAIISAAPNR